MEQPDFPYDLRGVWSKFKSYCPRLALILQKARVAAGEAESTTVEKTSVGGAVRSIDYFKAQSCRVSAWLADTERAKKIAAALDWVRRRGGEVTVRDVLTGKVDGCETMREAEKLIDDLERLGWGRIHDRKPPHGGHVTRVFVLHSANDQS